MDRVTLHLLTSRITHWLAREEGPLDSGLGGEDSGLLMAEDGWEFTIVDGICGLMVQSDLGSFESAFGSLERRPVEGVVICTAS